jgi:hypothetical protein
MFKRKFRRGLATLLTVTTVVWTFAFALSITTVAQAAAGDLIKSADSGTVYVVLADGESICSLTSEGHYDMWAQYKAKGVGRWQDVSTVDTSTYTDKGVCSLRTGSLVRTASDPEVFVIQSGNTKRGFDAWETFVADGYGSGGVYYVGSEALAKYTTGDKITSATTASEIREGQLVKYADSATVYYIASEDGSLVKREVTNEDAYFSNFGINWNLVITIPDTETYTTSSSQITGADTSINRPVAIEEETTPVATGLTVSLASDTPASGTLVQGQAIADLAHFTFTALAEKDLTVTKLKMQRIGVSADATLSAVYLYDGATRLSDSATVSSTYITVNDSTGLFTVPAGDSKTIAVKSNIADSTYGETVGVQIVAAADVTSTADTVSGTFPVKGNIHSIASATLATVTLGTTTPTENTAVQPGETEFLVWKNPVVVATRDVTLNYLTLREIGSIDKDDLQNLKLFVNGTQVGETQTELDSNYYVTFDLSASPVTLKTGTRNIEVKADVIDGSNKNYTFSLRQAADIVLVDSQYNANITISGTTPASSSTQTVAVGSITVTKKTDSPSGNVINSASNVTLGVYEFKAYGEDVKVETLRITFTGVDVDNSNNGTTIGKLRNGAIFADGVQVGSTADINEDSQSTPYTSYSLGSSLIVSPDSPVTIEIKADIFDSDGTNSISATDTIQVKIVGGDLNNGQAQTSLSILDVPAGNVDANTVTVVTGSLSGDKDYSYGNQTTIAGLSAYKIGDYVLVAAEGEDVNISAFTVTVAITNDAGGSTTNTAANSVSNLYVKYADNTTTPKSAAAASNSFSVSYTLANNSQIEVAVYADLSNTFDADDTVITTLDVTGLTADSASTADLTDGPKTGQTITFATGSISAALDGTTPVDQIAVAQASDVKAGTYKFTTQNAPVTVKDITVKLVTAASDRSVQYAKLDIDNDGTADTPAVSFVRTSGVPYAAFTGLNFEIAKDTSQKVSVLLTLNDVTTNGTSGDDVQVSLYNYKYSIAGTESTSSAQNINANNVYVRNTIPTVTKLSTSGALQNGTEMDIYEFKVTADSNADVALKQLKFAVAINDNVGTNNPLTLGAFKLYRGSTSLTDNVAITNASTSPQNLKTGGSSLAEGSSTVIVRWTTEEVIQKGTSSTYTIKATPSGFTTSADDDYFTIQMSGDASAPTSGHTYLVDTDTTTSEYVAALGLVDASASTAANFIWSDNAKSPHASTLVDNTGASYTATSSADWINAYLLKEDIPSAAVQFTF